MSSRFVSTGAIDVETGDSVPIPAPAPAPQSSSSSSSAAPPNNKNAEWAAVQAQLETERQAREAKRKAEAQGEPSLFAVLEANKAAKQAAFEEANKISNQFRALDEDEIGFLEEVQQRKREEEERVRRETEEGLRVFREARKGEVVDDAAEGDEAVAGGGWRVGGKRKRKKGEGEGAGGLLKGVKRRSSNGVAAGKDGLEDGKDGSKSQRQDKAVEGAELSSHRKEAAPVPSAAKPPAAAAAAAAPKSKPKLGLVDYGSDDDSE